MAEQYKFIYFNVRGRGELIRYIFAQANVPFEEVLIPFEEWPKEKSKMPFGAIPVLEVNGKALCQSTTIARYLAEKYGLAGKDEWTKAYADMLVQTVEDIYAHYKDYVTAWKSGDEAGKEEAKKVLLSEFYKPLFEKYENILGNKKYFSGDQLTYADFAIAELSDRVDEFFEKKITDDYPNVKAHMKRIHELPNIKKYLENRPERGVKGI